MTPAPPDDARHGDDRDSGEQRRRSAPLAVVSRPPAESLTRHEERSVMSEASRTRQADPDFDIPGFNSRITVRFRTNPFEFVTSPSLDFVPPSVPKSLILLAK